MQWFFSRSLISFYFSFLFFYIFCSHSIIFHSICVVLNSFVTWNKMHACSSCLTGWLTGGAAEKEIWCALDEHAIRNTVHRTLNSRRPHSHIVQFSTFLTLDRCTMIVVRPPQNEWHHRRVVTGRVDCSFGTCSLCTLTVSVRIRQLAKQQLFSIIIRGSYHLPPDHWNRSKSMKKAYFSFAIIILCAFWYTTKWQTLACRNTAAQARAEAKNVAISMGDSAECRPHVEPTLDNFDIFKVFYRKFFCLEKLWKLVQTIRLNGLQYCR